MTYGPVKSLVGHRKAYAKVVSIKCFKNGDTLSKDEIAKNGGNSSMIHVDWMIGSDAINIDGLDKDGKATPVFRTGEWAL